MSAANPTTKGLRTPDSPTEATEANPVQYPSLEPSVEELLNALPNPNPVPLKWDSPALRYAPKGGPDGQPEVTPEEAWQKCHHLVEKYDKGLCESYREQIDTLLVFAGLFSAVVTAFAVESYKWLQDDPTDTSAELLRQIVQLLANGTDSTPIAVPSLGRSLPDAAAARINLYWFLSLTLSLSTALVGIVCKQWVREYERDVGQSPREALGVRQVKFEGLEYWKVGAVVASVPLLLQLALALFLIGILELLWRLHTGLATAVTVVAGLTVIFYIFTALLPLWQCVYVSVLSALGERGFRGGAFARAQCPYKSPQAWLALRLFQPVIGYFMATGVKAQLHRPRGSWISFDTEWALRRDASLGSVTTSCRALAWAARCLGETHLNAWVFICSWPEWVRAASSPRDYTMYSTDTNLEHVANRRSPSSPSTDFDTLSLRAQSALFWCSCRTDLSINTAVELFLRIALRARFDAAWVASSLHHVFDTYRTVRPTLSDDLALSLFRLVQNAPLSSETRDGTIDASSVFCATVTIFRWAPAHKTLVPAFCAVVLDWLHQASSVYNDTWHAKVAADVLLSVSWYVYDINISPIDVHALRGFRHVIGLAKYMATKRPDYVNRLQVRDTLERLALLEVLTGDETGEFDGLQLGEAAVRPEPSRRSTVMATSTHRDTDAIADRTLVRRMRTREGTDE
ncbi:hypothetical protein EXIGLDRAFT_643272 [Exidia glandulosa HHB12029]|uniref:DUF6535 domain-containing protein n=1 Tax=Exidia glandulosa HHB12029 TaxID=1314781 RepID=A0A166AYR3_EXIGL|nr:hypothetical protein EXIGLDRAFT_643272 [Exidia glandulosa HHB12029]